MTTLDSIYVTIVSEVKKKVKEKEITTSNQTGLRKSIGVINNIDVLNYIINRRIESRKGSMTETIVNLKAAFDSLDREEIRR